MSWWWRWGRWSFVFLVTLNRREWRQLWDMASGDFFAFVLAVALVDQLWSGPGWRLALCLPAFFICEYAVVKDLVGWLSWISLHRKLARNVAKLAMLEALEKAS